MITAKTGKVDYAASLRCYNKNIQHLLNKFLQNQGRSASIFSKFPVKLLVYRSVKPVIKEGVLIMSEGEIIGINGSISNRVVASILKEDTYPVPENTRFLSFDSWTEQQKELIDTGEDIVHHVTINEYGMAGNGLRTQSCMTYMKTSVQNAFTEAGEKATRNGYPLKFYSTLMLPTGSCSVGSVITSYLAKENFGLHTLTHSVIPDILSAESYQIINAIYSNAVASFQPVVLIPENFASIPEEVIRRAEVAAGGRPSNFYILCQFFLELNFKLSRLIGGLDEGNTEEDEDELSFLNVEEKQVRNQSSELEAAIAGRQELFTAYHSPCFSKKCNWGKMATIAPMIKPVEPRDIIVLVEYDYLSYSEDDIQNHLKSSFDHQELQVERFLYLPSDTNALTIWIPTEVPAAFKQLVRYIKGEKPLKDVLEKWAKHGILSNLPPILRGRETKILKNRMNQIFCRDKSELEDIARSKYAMSYEELVKRNLLFWLAENEDVYIRPVGGEL